MSEFGHIHASGAGCHIDAWGAGPFVIEVKGKSYRFEDSDRFGPYLVNERCDILDRQPSERSPFWSAHRVWVKQGRRLGEDGESCIWDEPKPCRIVKISPRSKTCIVIDPGEEDGETIIVDDPAVREEAIRQFMAKMNKSPAPPATPSPTTGGER